jgi:hypothetical protein
VLGWKRIRDMDENNRITITVCGDGGCGTFSNFPSTRKLEGQRSTKT